MIIKRLFSNILLAVNNSTRNKSVQIYEALELASSRNRNLHILYIDDSRHLNWDSLQQFSFFNNAYDDQLEEQIATGLSFTENNCPMPVSLIIPQ